MNPSVRSSCIALLALCSLPSLAPNALAASNTLKYTYDALGRLTFVEDAVNGNRDYDYDAAGNRIQVNVGLEHDDGVPVVKLSAPTGLSCNGPLSRSGGYKASWQPVAGAAFYIYEDWNGKEIHVSTTTATLEGKCFYVRACESSNACGAKTNF